MNVLPCAALSFAQMIETDEDFNPLPGGYDYLVDFLDLSFPKERPSREHPYEEVSSSPGGDPFPFLSLSLSTFPLSSLLLLSITCFLPSPLPPPPLLLTQKQSQNK